MAPQLRAFLEALQIVLCVIAVLLAIKVVWHAHRATQYAIKAKRHADRACTLAKALADARDRRRRELDR